MNFFCCWCYYFSDANTWKIYLPQKLSSVKVAFFFLILLVDSVHAPFTHAALFLVSNCTVHKTVSLRSSNCWKIDFTESSVIPHFLISLIVIVAFTKFLNTRSLDFLWCSRTLALQRQTIAPLYPSPYSLNTIFLRLTEVAYKWSKGYNDRQWIRKKGK